MQRCRGQTNCECDDFVAQEATTTRQNRAAQQRFRTGVSNRRFADYQNGTCIRVRRAEDERAKSLHRGCQKAKLSMGRTNETLSSAGGFKRVCLSASRALILYDEAGASYPVLLRHLKLVIAIEK